MDRSIKNIIFDLGGVIINIDRQRCIEAFKAIGVKEVSDYVDDSRQEDIFHELEIGAIRPEEFCEQVRIKSKCNITDQQIAEAWNAMLKDIPVKRLERLLQLRDRYMIYLLSNTNEIHWKRCCELLSSYHGFYAENYFEQIFLSYEMHLIKPSEAIFNQVLSDAGIRAEETLFVDDSEVNCLAARQVGIKTYQVKQGEDWTDII